MLKGKILKSTLVLMLVLFILEDAFGEDRSDNRIKSQYRRGSRIRRGGSRIRPGGNICGAGCGMPDWLFILLIIAASVGALAAISAFVYYCCCQDEAGPEEHQMSETPQ